ncbi:gephyrin-like molybdotransferase Glp [Bacteroidota bacterium]
MIKFEKALNIIKENTILLDTEEVELNESLNRVLRTQVLSDLDMPPFNKSAMDGYACRKDDIENELTVIETIPAGSRPQNVIGENQCAKIMTGAMMPEGADCVIIVEEVDQTRENKIKFTKEKTSDNICFIGEDVVEGQVLVESGIRITTKEIGAMALSGCVKPIVSLKPRVGIIATGNEIVEPHLVPDESQIRNSNASQLFAQALNFGCAPEYYGIVEDTPESIRNTVLKAKGENDLIILTGGVSMGDFDLVPGILKELGFELFFEKVAVQPGKPTVFGRSDDKFVFGLPGNPVSTFIIFEVMVKELLAGMMGLEKYAKIFKAELAESIKRKKNVRLAWLPVMINENGTVEKVEYHGSAHITSIAKADGLINITVGEFEIKKGTFIDVRQF